MSENETAIRVRNLGKMYRRYGSDFERLFDAFGVPKALQWRSKSTKEFWALRGIDLVVKKGERVGIIGPNGAGKSTLLKMIAGTVAATEGTAEVSGRIQALMQTGTGFHPEFTGRENIRASLAYEGLTSEQIRKKEGEVIEFSELGEFIDQPVKTYSGGMHARLAFSAATSIEPEILIVDEVLSAGDAYFSGKCLERMRRITSRAGCTVLFVSHDRGSMQYLCDRIVWLDGGHVRQDGASLDVLRAYYRDTQERRHSHDQRKPSSVIVPGGPADRSVVTWRKADPRIEKVSFRGADGADVAAIEEGGDLTVAVHYYSSREVRNPVFSVTIYHARGMRICQMNSKIAGSGIESIKGSGRVEFRLSPFYGGPADYVVSCAIFKDLDLGGVSQSEFYDQHDRAYRFSVWKKTGIGLDLGMIANPWRMEFRPDAAEGGAVGPGGEESGRERG